MKKPSHEAQQAVFTATGVAKFTETHCIKECEWLVYGKLNISMPHDYIGICCACRQVLEMDIKTAEFKRLEMCIDQTDIFRTQNKER